MHVVQLGGDRTMYMSLIHGQRLKVLDQTKLGRDATMQGGEGQLQLHHAIYLSYVVGYVITNIGILQKIKILETIKFQNLGGELPVKGFGAESQFCQIFWSGQYYGNASHSILGYVDCMDGNNIVEYIKYSVLECWMGSYLSWSSRHTMYLLHLYSLAPEQRRRRVTQIEMNY